VCTKRTTVASLVASLALCLCALGNAAAPPTFSNARTKVASGTWSGHAWTFLATDSLDGTTFSYCTRVTIATAPATAPVDGVCGANEGGPPKPRPFPGTPSGWPYGLSYSWSHQCDSLGYGVLTGITSAAAKRLTITLASHKTVRTAAIAPPAGLVQSVRFFVVRIPCETTPTILTAYDKNGKVVGRFRPAFFHRP
jgi:hypothetical protein